MRRSATSRRSTLSRDAWSGLLQLQLILSLLIFLPEGTLHYWQGWVYWSLCFACFGGITLDLVRNDPELLARRMKAGPGAEARPLQKRLQAIASSAGIALLVVSALDHRRQWSAVPVAAVLIGDLTVVLGCAVIWRVFRENHFTAATIQVESEQPLTDTGPYAIVRHPMYTGALLVLFGTPLALGSLWGLIFAAVLLGAIIARLLDEERLLIQELPGYVDYQARVRARLIPGLW